MCNILKSDAFLALLLYIFLVMKKPITLFVFLLLSSISFLAKAQNDSVFITGKVYDYESQETLKKAIFIHNNQITNLKEDGSFACYVKKGDTLSFRYTGHDNYTIIVDENLDKLSYISGIFLNQQEIDASSFILKPRLHNAKSFASYDPLQMEQMMNNARRTITVASYQANKAREWDAQDNQKYSMTQKEVELEYKNAIAPAQQVGVDTRASIYDPIATLEIQKKINAKIPEEKELSADEDFYLRTLFIHYKDSISQ